MENLILLFICLITGILLRYYRLVPEKSYQLLNQLLICVFIPAITFLHIAETTFNASFFLPIITPWIVYTSSFLFFSFYAIINKTKKADIGTLILTGGISSISFVGFPIFEMLYGKQGLEAGIMMSQAGTFLVCSTLGVITASLYGAEKLTVITMITNILKFPPFIAFSFALLLNLLHYRHPIIIRDVLEKIGSPFSVIALITIGLQIEFSKNIINNKLLIAGLFFKLIIAPLIVFILMLLCFDRFGMIQEICVLGAAMGSMNTAAILVYRHKLNEALAAKMVAIGIPLSLPLIYIIHLLLKQIIDL